MTSRHRRLAVSGLVVFATAVLPAGTAAAQDVPPVPPVPPISGLQQDNGGGSQSLTVPGGSIVQTPEGQTFVPEGFVLQQGGDGQQVVPQ